MPDFKSVFHPVVIMPDEYWVFDFTKPSPKQWRCPLDYQIGRYDEHRPGMYNTELFSDGRDLHVGLDIGAPVETEIFAFADGIVHSFGVNPEDGSYGPTIITEHEVRLPVSVGSNEMGDSQRIWVLHGHLSSNSLAGLSIGQKISGGQKIATIGNEQENGGWPPHLHIQISLKQPKENDMPGVVHLSNREAALTQYIDPRLILGKLY